MCFSLRLHVVIVTIVNGTIRVLLILELVSYMPVVVTADGSFSSPSFPSLLSSSLLLSVVMNYIFRIDFVFIHE